ncbi:ABC transporter substrate-binding protein [Propionibacteriaceae bacterium G1746]|uniref:ABC transporter substrate-binding protein n=1 Tax=Aestuariimicrobium sp. G57 TaxID=3418485 RepID=UPI003C25011B
MTSNPFQHRLPRRSALMIAGGVAGGMALTACGSDSGSDVPASTSDPSTLSGSITVWYPPIGGDIERPYWDAQIKKFNAAYPNVKVSVEIIPWDSRGERMSTAIKGKTTPDLTYALPADIYNWGSGGLLVPLDDVLADKDKYLPNALSTMTYDGKLYGAPTVMGLTTTLHVKPVWDAMGIDAANYPKTFDEVKELAPKLKEKGYYITQYDAAPTMTLNGSFYPLLWSAGGTVLNEEGTKATLNGSEGLRALEFAKWLVDGGHTPKDALTQQLPVETSPIAQKKVAMLFSRSTASLLLNGLKLDELVVAEPLADAKSAGYGNVGAWVIFNESKNKQAAAAWFNFQNTPENLKEFLPPRNQQSPRSDVTGLYKEGTPEAVLSTMMDKGVTEPKSPKATEIMGIIKPEVQAALLGQKEPQKALDDAAAKIDAALAKK